jgi:hypothetical protein
MSQTFQQLYSMEGPQPLERFVVKVDFERVDDL